MKLKVLTTLVVALAVLGIGLESIAARVAAAVVQPARLLNKES